MGVPNFAAKIVPMIPFRTGEWNRDFIKYRVLDSEVPGLGFRKYLVVSRFASGFVCRFSRGVSGGTSRHPQGAIFEYVLHNIIIIRVHRACT